MENQSSQTNETFVYKVPVYVGWIINVLAWVIFVATSNHFLEIVMAFACVFAIYVGYKHKNNRLMTSSAFDAVWMFAWGLGLFGHLF